MEQQSAHLRVNITTPMLREVTVVRHAEMSFSEVRQSSTQAVDGLPFMPPPKMMRLCLLKMHLLLHEFALKFVARTADRI